MRATLLSPTVRHEVERELLTRLQAVVLDTVLDSAPTRDTTAVLPLAIDLLLTMEEEFRRRA